MTVDIAPTEAAAFTILRAYLLSILPDGIEIIRGQINRVSEPLVDDYVVMWTLRLPRIETNADTFEETSFTASIADTTMTVTAVEQGEIEVGDLLSAIDIADGTTVTALGTGTGGIGTYAVSPSQTLTGRTIAAGRSSYLQPVEWVVQLDVHGPNSAANALIISTLMRDAQSTEYFETADPTGALVPLYTGDPQFAPWINDQQQTEFKYAVEARIQMNSEVVIRGQQFAGTLEAELINVEATYPA